MVASHNVGGRQKNLTLRGLWHLVRRVTSASVPASRVQSTRKFRRHKFIHPKGIGTAANLLLAYASNQLHDAFISGTWRLRGGVKGYDQRAIGPLKDARRRIGQVLTPRRLSSIRPVTLRNEIEKLLVAAKKRVVAGIKLSSGSSPDLTSTREEAGAAQKKVDGARSKLPRYGYGRHKWRLKTARMRIVSVLRMKSAGEKYAALSLADRAALAFLASTGQRVTAPAGASAKKRWKAKMGTISGKVEAATFFLYGTRKWTGSPVKKFGGKRYLLKAPVLGQYRGFVGRYKEITKILKTLAASAKAAAVGTQKRTP